MHCQYMFRRVGFEEKKHSILICRQGLLDIFQEQPTFEKFPEGSGDDVEKHSLYYFLYWAKKGWLWITTHTSWLTWGSSRYMN